MTPPHLALSLPHLSPSPPPPVARLLTSRTLFPTSLLPLRPCAPVPLRPCATVPVAYRLSPACSYESYPLALKDSGAVAANGVTQFTGGAQVHSSTNRHTPTHPHPCTVACAQGRVGWLFSPHSLSPRDLSIHFIGAGLHSQVADQAPRGAPHHHHEGRLAPARSRRARRPRRGRGRWRRQLPGHGHGGATYLVPYLALSRPLSNTGAWAWRCDLSCPLFSPV